MTEVTRALHEHRITIKELKLNPEDLAALLVMVDRNELSNTAAKELFEAMASSGDDLETVMDRSSVETGGISGEKLKAVIKAVMEQNQDVVEIIRSGKDKKNKKTKFLQGLVMRETKGQSDPREVAEMLQNMTEK